MNTRAVDEHQLLATIGREAWADRFGDEIHTACPQMAKHVQHCCTLRPGERLVNTNRPGRS